MVGSKYWLGRAGDMLCCLQVTPKALLEVAGAIPAHAIEGLISSCEGGSFKELQRSMTDLIADGYPVRSCNQSCLLALLTIYVLSNCRY